MNEYLEIARSWWTILRLPLLMLLLWLLIRRKGDLSQETRIEVDSLQDHKIEQKTAEKQHYEPLPTDKPRKAPKKFTRTTPKQVLPIHVEKPTQHSEQPTEIHIFCGSQLQRTSALAKYLLTLISEHAYLHDVSSIPNLDDYFLQHPENSLYLMLFPSYANDSGPTQPLIEALEETLNDFRVDANPLQGLRGFAVFGIGDREGWPLKYEYCYQAAKVEKLMEKLGAKKVFAMGFGNSKGRTSLESQLEGWVTGVLNSLRNPLLESDVPSASPIQEECSQSNEDEIEAPLLDVEEIGPIAQRRRSNVKDFTPKPMVSKTSTTYAALTKQGYTIVGTHSGVKICRWTKSALRGRGSCYKFSFYGIKSHLCMETTPSLACANKCVFCWRHGTNPVGTSWRWQVDPPEIIYKGALEGHYQKINMLKGMMGVRPERLKEARRVRHCALSLVGEPIFCVPFRRIQTDLRSTY